jgi:hypothetical protein
MAPNDTSLSSLLRDLITEISELMRQEFRLARAETTAKLARAQTALIAMAAGLLFGFCAVLVLLEAAVAGLTEVMPPWAAALVVAGVTAVLAFACFMIGQRMLAPTNLVPERTIESLRQDRDMVMEKAR